MNIPNVGDNLGIATTQGGTGVPTMGITGTQKLAKNYAVGAWGERLMSMRAKAEMKSPTSESETSAVVVEGKVAERESKVPLATWRI